MSEQFSEDFTIRTEHYERRTRITDINKAHVLAHAIDWRATQLAKEPRGRDVSWHESYIADDIVAIGSLYDQEQPKSDRDISTLTRRDEPTSRYADSDKAQAVANEIYGNMNEAHGYPYYDGPYSRNYEDVDIAEAQAKKLRALANANSGAQAAEHFYDLKHSQIGTGRVDNIEKAEIMASVGASCMNSPAHTGRVTEYVVCQMNIAGGEYDMYGPTIAGRPKILSRDKDGKVIRLDPEGTPLGFKFGD